MLVQPDVINPSAPAKAIKLLKVRRQFDILQELQQFRTESGKNEV
jgi:hypothetical protein